MSRPDAGTRFRENLRRILEYPEIAERFTEMEKLVVDQIVVTDDPEERLELCRYLKTIRNFKMGVATFKMQERDARKRMKTDG